MAEPWEQLPGESTRAHTGFTVYRELGPSRTLRKVRTDWGRIGDELGADLGNPPSATSVDRWSVQHAWRIRAQGYDQKLDSDWVLEKQDARRERARLNAKMAAFGMQKVWERLQTMNWAEASFLDLRRMIDSLSRLERLALGESTENIQVTGKDGGPVVIEDLAKLTDEQRAERMGDIRDEIDRRLAEAENGPLL